MSKELRESKLVMLALFAILTGMLASSIAEAFSVEFTPVSVSVCGAYPNISMVSARVLNDNNYTATNLVATFNTNQSGLISLTEMSHNLGNLGANSYSPAFSWVFSCADGLNKAYRVYLNISSGEQNYSSRDVSYSVVSTFGQPPMTPPGALPEIVNLSLARKSQTDIEISARTNVDTLCKISNSNVGYDAMSSYMLGSGVNHSILLSLGQGAYNYYVLCKDFIGNIVASPRMVSFAVDSTGPVVGVHMDKAVFNTEEAKFNVTTSEDATCEINMLYPDSKKISLPGTGLLHPVSLVLDEGFYTWLVRCVDTSGNIGQSAFSLEIDLAPSVIIEIDTNRSRLGAGVFTVKVISSENLIAAPNLKLVIQDQKRDVPLAGSNRDWEGYILIDKQANEQVGSFEITAVDTSGNEGNDIRSGKSFIIDTLAPPAPQDVYGELIGERVALRWYYSGEDVDHFNIFRSTQPYVGLANYLTSTKDTRYVDLINLSAEKYYYAVNAVDLAGNDGELSKEVTIIAKQAEQQLVEMGDGSVIEIFISNESLSKIESLLSEAGKLKFDLQSASLGVSSEEQDLRAKLGVQETIDSAVGTLNQIESELKLLRLSRLKDFEIDARLQVYRSRLGELESTPNKVAIIESSDYIQSPMTGADKIIGNLPLAETNRAKYLEAVQQYISGAETEKKVTAVRISHLDGFEEHKTIIQEKIKSQADDVILLVMPIPASEITVIGEKYRLLDANLLEFSKKGLSEISYVVNGTVDKEGANAFFAFAIPDYSTFQPSEKPLLDSVTGKIAQEAERYGLTFTEVLVIISGISAIGILMLYYQFFVKGKVPLFLRDKSLEELQKSAADEISELQRIAGKEPDAPPRDTGKIARKPEKVEAAKIEEMPKLTEQISDKAEDSGEKRSGENGSGENKQAAVQEGKKAATDTSQKEDLKKTGILGNDIEFETQMHEMVFQIDLGKKADATAAYDKLMRMYANLSKETKKRYYKDCLELYTRLSKKK